MKCCVVGGAGFIGAEVIRLLARSGRDVVVMGRSPIDASKLPKGVQYDRGDYGDRNRLKAILAGASEVIDLAFATAPQTSFADPIFDVIANVPASVGLLEEAVAAQIAKVILVSSGGTVYGVPRELPITEDHPTRPISPYGITKLAIENYGRMFNTLFDLPVITVRPANAYGEGQRRLSGQGFIATALQRIKQGDHVEVYGEHGTVRDYIHVTDIASGIVAALEKGQPGAVYNIGTGEGRNNMDVLRAIEPFAARAGLEVRIRRLPQRPFDVPSNVLDSERLRRATGWRPMVPFGEGIARLWEAVLGPVEV